MVLPRASGLSGAFGRTVFRRAGAQARARASRQIGRRTYASGHGGQQSSELPWILGSVVVTVPAAGWLWSQGPTKGEHGHDSHGDSHEEKTEEDSEEPAEEESKEEESSDEKPAEEESAEGQAESKDEESDEKEAPKEDEEDSDKPDSKAPGQINWTPDSKKGPGEGQKGERQPSETQAEKNEQSNSSGAKHPYLDDPEKSKKGAGPTETAKIHGTVDTSQPAR